MQNNKIIGFIGVGNMASSIITGLLANNYKIKNIKISDVDENLLLARKIQFNGIEGFDNNIELAKVSDVLILAVKPNQIQNVCNEINSNTDNKLIISIAAGVRESDINNWLGNNRAIVRAMPNTPALVKSGASGLYANKYASDDDKQLAESVLRAVGLTLWVDDEDKLDIITALSGSGPAYLFLLMEAMTKTAIELGLSKEQAHVLTVQTAVGASKIAEISDDDCKELRKKVTSPNGTTEAAIKIFKNKDFENIVKDAINAAHKRTKEIAKELSS